MLSDEYASLPRGLNDATASQPPQRTAPAAEAAPSMLSGRALPAPAHTAAGYDRWSRRRIAVAASSPAAFAHRLPQWAVRAVSAESARPFAGRRREASAAFPGGPD